MEAAGEGRQTIIDNLRAEYPDFYISKIRDNYHITSYDGLDKMLKIINDG